jgi:hypothetical protein
MLGKARQMPRIQESVSDFIQEYAWRDFITVTPRRPRRDSIAFIRDIWNVITAKENRFWSNPDGLQLPYRAFLACETFKFQKNLHCHGLINGLSYMYSPSTLQAALDYYIGRSRVENCRSHQDVAAYCSKYASKWSDGDNYDFLGAWVDKRV